MMRMTTLNASNPVGQAFWSMRVIYTLAPILFGLDKFFNVLTDWPKYLAPWIPNLIHVTPQNFMYGVGVIDINALCVVATILLIAAILACYIPARRAAKVDPMVALRYE